MKLFEFFSKPIESNQKDRDQKTKFDKDDLFWYILDHDKIHKDYFFEIASKIKKVKTLEPDAVLEMFMPMVKQGCKEYYNEKKLNGKLHKLFPEDLREEICHRLYDHYKEDIIADKYKLGN